MSIRFLCNYGVKVNASVNCYRLVEAVLKVFGQQYNVGEATGCLISENGMPADYLLGICLSVVTKGNRLVESPVSELAAKLSKTNLRAMDFITYLRAILPVLHGDHGHCNYDDAVNLLVDHGARSHSE